jgi:predicted DNA-binding WGR domain protein
MSSIPYYLEFNDAANNSHKFYAGLGTRVLYGRIGAKGTLKGYHAQKVSDMRYEKQKKGYKSAPMPQYVEDTLRGKNAAPVKKGQKNVVGIGEYWQNKLKKEVGANRGLLNWFSSLSRRD